MDATGPKGMTFQPDIYPKVLSLLPPPPARVLDAGAGEGYLSGLLAGRGYRVEACDYSPAGFKAQGVPFHRADLSEAIPLPDASFDIVVAVEVLEHLENQARFIREALRVVRPGGTVVLTTPNVTSLPSRWHFLLYGYTDCSPLPLDPAREDWHLQHISPISLPHILFFLERAGGELVALETNRYRRGAWPLMPFYPLLSLALRAKLLRRKHGGRNALHRRHLKWMLTPANLRGRITIAVARRRP